MKKLIALAVCMVIFISILASCAVKGENAAANSGSVSSRPQIAGSSISATSIPESSTPISSSSLSAVSSLPPESNAMGTKLLTLTMESVPVDGKNFMLSEML